MVGGSTAARGATRSSSHPPSLPRFAGSLLFCKDCGRTNHATRRFPGFPHRHGVSAPWSVRYCSGCTSGCSMSAPFATLRVALKLCRREDMSRCCTTLLHTRSPFRALTHLNCASPCRAGRLVPVRRHPVYRCDGRCEGRTQVSRVRPGQIRAAWARAIAGTPTKRSGRFHRSLPFSMQSGFQRSGVTRCSPTRPQPMRNYRDEVKKRIAGIRS
jgi:hypothetical protein